MPRVFNITAAPARDIDPLTSAEKSFDDNVRIFPLSENNARDTGGIQLRPPAGMEGQSYLNDPSIVVYSLDDPEQPAAQNFISREGRSGDVTRESLSPVPEVLLSDRGQVMAEPRNYVTIASPGEEMVRVYFDHDSASLEPEEVDKIAQISLGFNPNRPDAILSIEGHSSTESSIEDPVQRRIVNMRVSIDRAYNVARALMQAGIPGDKIRAVAWGEGRPPAGPGSGDSDMARRVEIIRMP